MDNQKCDGQELSSVAPSAGAISISKLLTPSQVADLLQIPVKSVHALCREGKLGFVKINGKERRFEPEQVHAYIASRTIDPCSQCQKCGRLAKSSVVPTPSPDKNPVDNPNQQPSLSTLKGGEERTAEESGKAFRAHCRKEMRSWR